MAHARAESCGVLGGSDMCVHCALEHCLGGLRMYISQNQEEACQVFLTGAVANLGKRSRVHAWEENLDVLLSGPLHADLEESNKFYIVAILA